MTKETDIVVLSLPTEKRYVLFTPQKEFFCDEHIYCQWKAGRSTGKTHAGALKAIDYALRRRGVVVIILSADADHSLALARCTFNLAHPDWIRRYHKYEYLLEFQNGSSIHYHTVLSTGRLRGVRAHALFADEIEGTYRRDALLLAVNCLRESDARMWETRELEGSSLLWNNHLPLPSDLRDE